MPYFYTSYRKTKPLRRCKEENEQSKEHHQNKIKRITMTTKIKTSKHGGKITINGITFFKDEASDVVHFVLFVKCKQTPSKLLIDKKYLTTGKNFEC